MIDLLVDGGAVFSPCRKYRYKLVRKWGPGDRYCNFIMLNPSTADEVANDPTVERCERRARSWWFDGLIVTNLFALRSTDPEELRKQPNPEGEPENSKAILESAQQSSMVVCAWGNHGMYCNRDIDIRFMLRQSGVKLYCLKLAKTGQPCHPLYLPYELKPTAWGEQ